MEATKWHFVLSFPAYLWLNLHFDGCEEGCGTSASGSGSQKGQVQLQVGSMKGDQLDEVAQQLCEVSISTAGCVTTALLLLCAFLTLFTCLLCLICNLSYTLASSFASVCSFNTF